MKKINIRKDKIFSVISATVLISFLACVFNLSVLISNVKAAQLTQAEDTLSDSDLGVKANHTIKFTTKTLISASSTIVIDFPDSFSTTSTPAFSETDPLDFDITTSTSNNITVNAAGSCPVSGLTEFEITSISAENVFTFTHCSGTDPIAVSTPLTIKIGTNTTVGGVGDSQIVNPPTAGSYQIDATAPAGTTAKILVAIIDDVVVTASVSTNFTFTIAGVASGQAINGDGVLTSTGATATELPFGELTPNTPKVLGQTLSVSTNAKNGFIVTVQQDQSLLSVNGADIDTFKDGASTATPEAWAVPTATLDSEATYGHYGITSEDSDLNIDEFGVAKYAGNLGTPRTVFSHTGPANGTTADKGQTRVGIKIEISALQEAANDYTNSLTYVATPTF
ncbi:MAG: hypothetical protein WC430_00635 [Patescibacteria group bacterium]